MIWLGDVAKGRDNNFNLIRMLAATAVLVSHAWPLVLGSGAIEPLEALTGHSLGTMAVFVFFALSVFLSPPVLTEPVRPRIFWLHGVCDSFPAFLFR